MIRVAQIIGQAIDGGTESCMMNYFRNIDHTKVQFDFFVESESKIIRRDKIEAMGGRVVIIPSYKHIFKYIKTLKRLFKEGQYDIVHSNMNALSVFTLYAAKKAGIKIRIAHSHSTSNKKEWKKNIIKNLLRPFSKKYATHYFACSELAGRWLFGDKTFDSGKVTIINNAIELERFKFDPELRKQMREELGIDRNYVIGHIGRFCEQKNHTFLIDIFNDVQKKLPEAKLLLIGNGELYDEIVAKVKELNLTDKVIFAGVHKHPERYYDAMDCFVLPSLYEGLPVVAVEAQANGLKCYLSDEITKEIGVLDTTEYIKIDSVAEWRDKLACAVETDREDGFKKLCDTKYNIVAEAEKLGELYDSFVKNNVGGGYSFVIWTEFKRVAPFVIGNVGRFCEQKNQEFLLDVFGEYNKRNSDSVLLLLGEGELHSSLEEKVADLGLKDKVIFAGVHKHPERYYDAMDCFVLPSLYEGLGMVLIEAQANGLPCIASTEVPTAAKVLENTMFLDLKQPLSVWTAELEKCRNTARTSDISKISDSGYDIIKESQKLLNYYEGMINDR